MKIKDEEKAFERLQEEQMKKEYEKIEKAGGKEMELKLELLKQNFLKQKGKPYSKPVSLSGVALSRELNEINLRAAEDIEAVKKEAIRQLDMIQSEDELYSLTSKAFQKEKEALEFEIEAWQEEQEEFFLSKEFNVIRTITEQETKPSGINSLSIKGKTIEMPSIAISDAALKAKIEIEAGSALSKQDPRGELSNGFCGNRHEIETELRQGAGTIRFLGSMNDHAAIGAVLDSENQTWFEYESIEVLDEEMKKNQPLLFSYIGKNGRSVFWEKKSEEALRLQVMIEMEKEMAVDEMEAVYFIKQKSGSSPANLTKVESFAKDGSKEDGIIEKQKAKLSGRVIQKVRMVFEQSSGYETMIAVPFLETRNEKRFFEEYVASEKLGRASEGREIKKAMPFDMKKMGLIYSEKEKRWIYPAQTKEFTPSSTEDLIEEMEKQSENKDTDVKYAVMKAKRYLIGIRNIQMYVKPETVSGELKTQKIAFEEPIQEFSLEGSELGELLKYSFSVDGGKTFIPICPSSRVNANGIPKVYRIEKKKNKSGFDLSKGIVYTMSDVKELMLMIER